MSVETRDLAIAAHLWDQAPVLVVEDKGKTITIAESGAIIEWTISMYGPQLAPDPKTEPEDYAKYLYWMHAAEGTYMPLRLMSMVFNNVVKNTPFIVKMMAQRISDGVHKAFIVRLAFYWRGISHYRTEPSNNRHVATYGKRAEGKWRTVLCRKQVDRSRHQFVAPRFLMWRSG